MKLSRVSWFALAISMAACGDVELDETVSSADELVAGEDLSGESAALTLAQPPSPWGWRESSQFDGSKTEEWYDDDSFRIYGHSPTGNTLCVASGAGWNKRLTLYRRVGSGWQFQFKVDNESVTQGGSTVYRQHTDCAVEDERVVISFWVAESIGDNQLPNRSQLRTYDRVGDLWVSYDANVGPDSRYFSGIVLDGETVVARGFSEKGEHMFPVWVYKRVNKHWVFEQTLEQPAGGLPESDFGLNLDVSDGRIAVSSPGGAHVIDGTYYGATGEVHLFKRGALGWALETTLKGPSTGQPGDPEWFGSYFGSELGLSGGHLVVTGAVGKTSDGKSIDAVHDYTLRPAGWTKTGTVMGRIRALDVRKSRFVLTTENAARIYTQNYVLGPELEASFVLDAVWGDRAGLGDDRAFIAKPQYKFTKDGEEYVGLVQTFVYQRPPTLPKPPIELNL